MIGAVQLQACMQNPHAASVPFCQAAMLLESEETLGAVHKSSLEHQIALCHAEDEEFHETSETGMGSQFSSIFSSHSYSLLIMVLHHPFNRLQPGTALNRIVNI